MMSWTAVCATAQAKLATRNSTMQKSMSILRPAWARQRLCCHSEELKNVPTMSLMRPQIGQMAHCVMRYAVAIHAPLGPALSAVEMVAKAVAMMELSRMLSSTVTPNAKKICTLVSPPPPPPFRRRVEASLGAHESYAQRRQRPVGLICQAKLVLLTCRLRCSISSSLALFCCAQRWRCRPRAAGERHGVDDVHHPCSSRLAFAHGLTSCISISSRAFRSQHSARSRPTVCCCLRRLAGWGVPKGIALSRARQTPISGPCCRN